MVGMGQLVGRAVVGVGQLSGRAHWWSSVVGAGQLVELKGRGRISW